MGSNSTVNTAASRTGIFLTLSPGPWTSVNTGLIFLPSSATFPPLPKLLQGIISLTMITNIQELTLSLLPTSLSSPFFWTMALLFPGLPVSPTTVLQKNLKFYTLNGNFFQAKLPHRHFPLLRHHSIKATLFLKQPSPTSCTISKKIPHTAYFCHSTTSQMHPLPYQMSRIQSLLSPRNTFFLL